VSVVLALPDFLGVPVAAEELDSDADELSEDAPDHDGLLEEEDVAVPVAEGDDDAEALSVADADVEEDDDEVDVSVEEADIVGDALVVALAEELADCVDEADDDDDFVSGAEAEALPDAESEVCASEVMVILGEGVKDGDSLPRDEKDELAVIEKLDIGSLDVRDDRVDVCNGKEDKLAEAEADDDAAGVFETKVLTETTGLSDPNNDTLVDDVPLSVGLADDVSLVDSVASFETIADSDTDAEEEKLAEEDDEVESLVEAEGSVDDESVSVGLDVTDKVSVASVVPRGDDDDNDDCRAEAEVVLEADTALLIVGTFEGYWALDSVTIVFAEREGDCDTRLADLEVTIVADTVTLFSPELEADADGVADEVAVAEDEAVDNELAVSEALAVALLVTLEEDEDDAVAEAVAEALH
jgi:hypothetical protein